MKTKCPCRDYCGKPKPIPAGYAEMTFQSFKVDAKNKAAFEAARMFCTPAGKSVYLYGEPGNGKTHLMVAAMRAVAEIECSYKFSMHNVARLLKIDRHEYETREEAEDRLLGSLEKQNFLFLDDFSAENVTGRTSELLYLLLNDCVENRKPKLFITGNQSLQFVSKNISDRIASRIAGLCGLPNVIKIEGQDRRIFQGA